MNAEVVHSKKQSNQNSNSLKGYRKSRENKIKELVTEIALQGTT